MILNNRKSRRLWVLVLALSAVLFAVAQEKEKQKQKQPDIPDAPSVLRNPQTLPPLPPPSSAPPEQPAPEPEKPASSSSLDKPSKTQTAPLPTSEAGPPPPGPTVTMAKPSAAPSSDESDLGKLTVDINFVAVPVTVRDNSGHLVNGLQSRDFTIKEDGVPQKIQFFTSDPITLSAAVVVDAGLPDVELRKVQETLPALAGAFSQFDEVSVYIFGNAVQQVSDFNAIGEKLDSAIRKVRAAHGSRGGVSYAGGPLNSGPTVNGKPADPNIATVPIVRPESHVLNDAILMAANDLARRPLTRRRMLFVISDGRELGSRASYQDVLKVLLSHEVAVYPLVVGASALPVYGTLQKIRIPGQGYGDILPRYSAATGTGEVLSEFSAKGIESAYAEVAAQARNEYTIGYTTRATAASNYRSIEVVVHRPNLKVYAKDGYYPLPPARK